jgi:hypothetical protein
MIIIAANTNSTPTTELSNKSSRILANLFDITTLLPAGPGSIGARPAMAGATTLAQRQKIIPCSTFPLSGNNEIK